MKNNNISSKSTVPKQVKELWDFYASKNKNELITLNLALKEIAPIGDKPTLAWVTIPMVHPHTTDLSFEKEWGRITKMGQVLAYEVEADTNSIPVALKTGGGSEIIYFYCSDTDLVNESVSTFMEGFTDYQFEINFQEDKEWKVYSGLYPSDRQFQSIKNRFVIDQLIEMGDHLLKPREVKHTIFFKSNAGRKSFLKKAKKQGFTVNSKFTENSIKGHPYGLVVSRIDKVDWESVDKYVTYLWELSKQYKGFYDGWATWSEGTASPTPPGFQNDFEDYKG